MQRLLCATCALLVSAANAADRWSDPATWPSGVVPTAGQDVMIPSDREILFDLPAADLGSLMVHGTLAFEDAQDINLSAARIMVHGPAALLKAGTPTAPFTHNLTITLTETVGDESAAPPMGYRVLGVMEGAALQLHGASAAQTSWTQLSGDLPPGATQLTLVAPVAWQVGDTLAIAPSGYDARETERVTVTSISADGTMLTFTPPLRHSHQGSVHPYAGKSIDMRAEIARLNRNITLTAPASATNDQLGFHTMIMPSAGPVNLSGVAFVRGGQIRRPGRYPFHWHRNPELEEQYGSRGWMIRAVDRTGDWLRNCSFVESFQRAVVCHGVDNTRVEDSVAYDIFSHAFVTSEDGHEIGNTFERNLTMLIKRRDREDFSFPRDDHTESDQAEHRPAGFWGRNPFNPMRNNHAAGTLEGIGFFIDSRLQSHDNKRLIQREQSQRETFVFEGNRAHSNYRANVAGGGIPTYGPKTRAHGLMIGDYNGVPAVVQDFQAYKNSVGGIWIEDEAHVVTNAILTDASLGLLALRSRIEDTVIVQQSVNTIGRAPQVLGNRRTPGGGIHLQPTGYGLYPQLDGVTFINCQPAAVVAWSDPYGSDTYATFANISLVNTPPILQHGDPDDITGAIVDLDGSLSGYGAGAQIGGHDLLPDGAFFDTAANAYVVAGTPRCLGDANADNVVNEGDLAIVLSSFGAPGPEADLDRNGRVGLSDLTLVLVHFGQVCP